jgi:hypothetical protein
MGNEPSKSKMEGLQTDRHHCKSNSSTFAYESYLAESSSITSDGSSTQSVHLPHRTDTVSSSNSAESDTRHKKKRTPFKTAKDFLLNSGKSPRFPDRPLYRSDQTSSTSSLQHNHTKSSTDDSADGMRSSLSSTNVTFASTSEQNGESEEPNYQVAEKGCNAGYNLMNQIFTLEAYNTLFNR